MVDVRVACYCRVSTEEQTNENQKVRLKEYCDRYNYNPVFFEEKISSRKTRPIKQELLKLLRQKRFDILIFWKLDRWARKMSELVFEIEELINKGINVISLSDNIDLSSSSGRLQFQILCSFAEFERNLISERTKEGLNRARKQGKKLGRPFGSKDSKRRKKGGYYLRYANSK